MKIDKHVTDLNDDGFKDIWLTISSGGSYGDDSYLLFYNPATKGLVLNDKTLRNLEIRGKKVRSYTRFTSDTYEIEGFTLRLKETTGFLQGEYEDKKVVTRYDNLGNVIQTDTLMAGPND